MAARTSRTAPSTRATRGSSRRARSASATTSSRPSSIFINVGGRAATPLRHRGPRRDPVLDELLDDGRRLRAAAPRHRRRQLHRPRVRADVPAVRQPTVTVVEMSPRLIAREDEDVSAAIRGHPRERGHRGAHGREVHRAREGAVGRARPGRLRGGPPVVDGTHLLLAVGRRPNTDDLGLDRAGVATDARGYIDVDDQLRTNVDGIWALGDCNGRGAFTHTAYNDFEIVAANLLDHDPRRVSDRIDDLRALHRSAARPRRHDRGRRAKAGRQRSSSASGR